MGKQCLSKITPEADTSRQKMRCCGCGVKHSRYNSGVSIVHGQNGSTELQTEFDRNTDHIVDRDRNADRSAELYKQNLFHVPWMRASHGWFYRQECLGVFWNGASKMERVLETLEGIRAHNNLVQQSALMIVVGPHAGMPDLAVRVRVAEAMKRAERQLLSVCLVLDAGLVDPVLVRSIATMLFKTSGVGIPLRVYQSFHEVAAYYEQKGVLRGVAGLEFADTLVKLHSSHLAMKHESSDVRPKKRT